MDRPLLDQDDMQPTMTKRPWADFIQGLVPTQGRKPVLLKRLSQLAQAPQIYWYPGCGTDLSPLILDVPNNPTGRRLYRTNTAKEDQSAPIVLWMNDYSTHQDGFPRPGPIAVHYSHETGSFRWEYSGDDKWRGWNRYETWLSVERHQERYVFEGEIPVCLFTVTVRNKNQGHHTRPAEGDRYLVIYSNCASHELLGKVLAPFGIRPICVALIRQGGFSSQLFYEHTSTCPPGLVSVKQRWVAPLICT